jgi:hypothetical protein
VDLHLDAVEQVLAHRRSHVLVSRQNEAHIRFNFVLWAAADGDHRPPFGHIE